MKPLTEKEIDEYKPCSDLDCADDVCAFARQLMEARAENERLTHMLDDAVNLMVGVQAERDAAIEQVKQLSAWLPCDTDEKRGWLSKDVECHRDGISGPTCHKHTYQALAKAEAERDAAVERGVEVWKGAEQQRGMLLLLLWMRTVEHDDDHEELDRAEAREKGLREANKRLRRGFNIAQDEWEDWIVDQLERASQYERILAYAKKNRTALEGE